MDIQVGDRVTYIDKQGKKCIITVLEDKGELCDCKDNPVSEILKIERPKYEVVEEKKELLTEKEREFLKDMCNMCKYYNNISLIYFTEEAVIRFCNKVFYVIGALDYPNSLNFNNIEKGTYYTLKELGLEEK